MTNTIDNQQDVLDSRDVIERLEELRALEEAVRETEEAVKEAEKAVTKAETILDREQAEEDLADAMKDSESAQYEFDDQSQDEWEVLEELYDDASHSPDWVHGETLIRDSYFEEYARDFASDMGIVNGDEEWPLNHIDWEAAAEDLQRDYTCVDFDGVEYWIRA